MNNPSPLIPQGSLLEQKNRSRSRVKVAFFCVVGVHVAAIVVALLAQGCERNKGGGSGGAADAGGQQPIIQDTNPVPAYPTASNTLPPFESQSNNSVAVPAISNTAPQSIVDQQITPAVPAGQPTEYVVQKGDTYSSIAPKLHVSVKALEAANPSVTPTRMKEGQKLVVPPPSTASAGSGATTRAADTDSQSYVVKPGDNLTKIAQHFHVTVNALRRANNMTTDRIKAGDKLKIPAASIPATNPVPASGGATPVAPAPVGATPGAR